MTDLPWRGSASRVLGGALLATAGLLSAGVASATPAVAQPARLPAAPAALLPAAQAADLRAHEQLAPLRAEEAWQYSTGDGVTVAVIDSGVDAEHPALAGRVLPGQDYVDGSTDGRVDVVGHGTTVASLIAGGGEDSAVGLAPESTILPVRVLDDENRYQSATTVAEGVVWAVEQGAQVINLSLGGDRFSPSLSEALAFAMANDVVVIACTGNSTEPGQAQVWYPAREPGVVAVAGLTWSDGSAPTGWAQSLTGPETVLTAPALVTGAEAGAGYRAVQGTSFSAALAAATAALIRSRWPEMTAGEVVNRLVATAEDLGEPGRDPVYGFGMLDPVAALTDAVRPAPANPLDTTPSRGAAGFGPAPSDDSELSPPKTVRTARVDIVRGAPAGGAAYEPASAARDRPPLVLIWALPAVLYAVLAFAVAIRARRLS